MNNGLIRSLFFVFVLVLPVKIIKAQQKITFPGEDNLIITADYYRSHPDDPWVLFFHQADYSRGEFNDIAKKVRKMGYNCLAVDLRAGGAVNYIRNETVKSARENGLETSLYSALNDVLAAISFASQKSAKPVLLFGSSFSASLCIIAAVDNPSVKGVIAFSPGEFFTPVINVGEKISGFDKPLFVATSTREYPFVKEMIKEVPSRYITMVRPSEEYDGHGASMLWEDSPVSDEYWLSLMLFFRKLK